MTHCLKIFMAFMLITTAIVNGENFNRETKDYSYDVRVYTKLLNPDGSTTNQTLYISKRNPNALLPDKSTFTTVYSEELGEFVIERETLWGNNLIPVEVRFEVVYFKINSNTVYSTHSLSVGIDQDDIYITDVDPRDPLKKILVKTN
jgi:hypothetical protein